ncbi:MAG: hypothetical protein A4E71_01382 [Smithella sp. PtaU1.Bin162]|nr:MAG: hypothetical protein A4E71_01382 [Smithella sp. PtaU1.Bin162]
MNYRMAEEERIKRVLIYKRTHEGDPDPAMGVFGNHCCMGTVRGWNYDAVIGVGGTRPWPQYQGIAEKLNWIGIGPRRSGGVRRPKVAFDHFLYDGQKGPMLLDIAPTLAQRMYRKNARLLIATPSSSEWSDVKNILDLARTAPASGQLTGARRRNLHEKADECHSDSCSSTSAVRKTEQENPADAKEHRG